MEEFAKAQVATQEISPTQIFDRQPIQWFDGCIPFVVKS